MFNLDSGLKTRVNKFCNSVPNVCFAPDLDYFYSMQSKSFKHTAGVNIISAPKNAKSFLVQHHGSKTGLFFAIGKVAPKLFASFIVSPLRAKKSDKYKKRNEGKKQRNLQKKQ